MHLCFLHCTMIGVNVLTFSHDKECYFESRYHSHFSSLIILIFNCIHNSTGFTVISYSKSKFTCNAINTTPIQKKINVIKEKNMHVLHNLIKLTNFPEICHSFTPIYQFFRIFDISKNICIFQDIQFHL